MVAKKFSLKDNPIFESTAIPVKKNREKHPLNAIYSPSEKTKRKAGDTSPVFTDKIREWSVKKISTKMFFASIITLVAIPSFFIYLWWRGTLKISPPVPLITAARLFVPEAEHTQNPEEFLPKEVLPVIEALSPPLEEKELLSLPPRRLREQRWLLSAIIFDGANSRALLNRRIVRKGDTFQGGKVRVIEITLDSVVLAREEEKFTIKIETNKDN